MVVVGFVDSVSLALVGSLACWETLPIREGRGCESCIKMSCLRLSTLEKRALTMMMMMVVVERKLASFSSSFVSFWLVSPSWAERFQ